MEELAKSIPPQNVDELFDMLIEGVRNVPKCLQMMIDSICNIQEQFPMPRDSWERFIKDVEYTNEKHGFNLQVTRYKDE